MTAAILVISLLVMAHERECPVIPAIEQAVDYEINEIPGNLQATFTGGLQVSYPIVESSAESGAPACCVPGAYIIAEPILWRSGPGEPWQPTTKRGD